MSTARKFALTLSRLVFRLLLVAVITLGALYFSYSTPRQIKMSIVEADAYSRFVEGIINSNKLSDKNSIFADDKVAQITKDAFSPKLLQDSTEQFIDSWYNWLNGNTPKPTYSFDLTVQRQKLAQQLSIYAIDRISSLPTCTAFETNFTLDPFRASCQPPGLNYRQEQLNLEAQLIASKDFFPKVIYTDSDLPKSRSGLPISEELAYAPILFQMMPTLLVIMIAGLLLLATLLIMLRPVRRNGWRELGKNMLSSGIFLSVSAVIFGLLVPQITRSFQSQFTGNGTDLLISDIVRNLTVGFESIFISISLQIAAIGAVILVVLRQLKPASRYKGLEHVTGLVNSMRPTLDTLTSKRAIEAPVVTSERQRKPHKRAKKRKSKQPRISKEIT